VRPKPHSGAVADRRLRGFADDQRSRTSGGANEHRQLAVAIHTHACYPRIHGGMFPVTLSRSNPRAKPRWFATFIALVIATGLMASTALAVTLADAPTFTNTQIDTDGGIDDEPGQKDLNSHASATDSDGFWVQFNWDVTGVSGKNTADGCALFDTGGAAFVDAAICVTGEGKALTLQSVVLYTCSDGRIDRCTNPTVVNLGSTQCFITNDVAADPFHPGQKDAQATCLIDLDAIDASSTPVHVNTCSYPSREPNSDPSDCVIIPVPAGTSVGTLSGGSTSWSATLSDTATMNPTTATGSVVFKLWTNATCADADPTDAINDPIWVTNSVNLVSGVASTSGAGTASGSPTVTAAGTYYWTVDYTPTGLFNSSSSACGEATVVTAPTVAGSGG
jgi:hypothetical protein